MVIETQMSDTVLHEGKWLSLRVKEDPDKGIKGYEYVHNVPGNGKGVAVLPFRWTDTPDGPDDAVLEFLVVNEIIPAWKTSLTMCALTGLCDKASEAPAETAAREVYEESGYKVEASDLLSLRTCHVSKSSDTTLHTYTVDLTGKTPGEAPKDGPGLEQQLTTTWVTDPYSSMDPVLSVMWARLTSRLEFQHMDWDRLKERLLNDALQAHKQSEP